MIDRLFCAFLLLGSVGCFSEFKNFDWQRPSRLSPTAVLIDQVDPFIGSSGLWWASGHTSPAASVPFGLVKLGPDSSLLGKTLSHSGYAKNDPEIVGFSMTRYSGTGVAEGGILRSIPTNKPMSFDHLLDHRFIADKRTEMAKAGYYSVYLHNEKIKVELSATKRVGVQRYVFSEDNPYLAIELSSAHKGAAEDLSLTVTPSGFYGSALLKSGFSKRYAGLPVFFAAELSHPITAHRILQKNNVSTDASISWDGKKTSFLELAIGAASEEPILLKIGISHTSLAAAQTHLASQSANDFDDIRTLAENSWQSVLEKIQVEGGTSSDRIKFYSALYRSYLMPTDFSDESGEYLGADKQIHPSPGHVYFSDFSLWDTFRTVHPLYSLISRDEHLDMIKSLLIIYQQSGYLTRWFSGAGHTGSMLGAPAVITISEAYQKGLVSIDQNLATTAMEAALDPDLLTKGKECLREYVEKGFCSSSKKGSVSYTLEYAYADYALARYAEAIGDTNLKNKHDLRAKNALQNQFDHRFLAFLPKRPSGKFEDFGPKGPAWDDSSYLGLTKTGKAFVEGGAWHWRFYSFYDAPLMQSLFGTSFESLLDETFEKATTALGSAFPPYHYWHGNEPGFNQAYWYALNGNLKKTQKWVHWILKNKYSTNANGLDGDDDAGTLSAWFVFSAMGFYPIAGTSRYVLGLPLFDKVTIDMDGDTFVIEKFSKNKTSVKINGSKVTTAQIEHQDLIDGGILVFGEP